MQQKELGRKKEKANTKCQQVRYREEKLELSPTKTLEHSYGMGLNCPFK